ncbi:hypothetical protein GCM10010236_10660 [Streptomyces eurythermus]|nr:hypothetical protein GCM10010236_10660 [Streptomyces eurythermus]
MWVGVSTDRTEGPSVAAELCTGITTETRGTAPLLTRMGVVMDVVVAGQGYVGLPLAVRAAEAGHPATAVGIRDDLASEETFLENHRPPLG